MVTVYCNALQEKPQGRTTDTVCKLPSSTFSNAHAIQQIRNRNRRLKKRDQHQRNERRNKGIQKIDRIIIYYIVALPGSA